MLKKIIFLSLIFSFYYPCSEAQVFLPVDLTFDKLPVHSILIDKNTEDSTESVIKWIGTEKGVFRIREVTEEAKVEASTFLPKKSILLIQKDLKNNIWFLTYDNQVVVLGKNQEKRKLSFDFLKKKIVSSLLFENEKTVWIGSRGAGLWKKTDSKTQKVKLDKKNRAININSIKKFQNKIWVATEEGLFYADLNNKKLKFKSASGFTKVSQMIILDKKLWLLGYDKKDKSTLQSTADGKKWISYPMLNAFEYQLPNSMSFDNEKNIWMAADRVAKFNIKTKKWEEFGEKEGFQSTSALCLAVESNNVWVGTEGRGLFVRVVFPSPTFEEEESQESEDLAQIKEFEETLEEAQEEVSLESLIDKNPKELKGKKINLKIEFQTAKANILPEHHAVLDQIRQILNQNTNLKILIAGHTAPIGNTRKNLELSRQRAMQVRKYLIGKGISSDRVRTIGYGGSRPVTTDRTQMKENRRVEVVFID